MLTRTDIFSGFLGAGKTTLIRKLIAEGYKNEKLVLIENEFGEIAIDGGFLRDSGVEITEMNSGCICCTLVGDFTAALQKVISDYSPDRIIIEPSGVGKLSDVAKAVASVPGIEIGSKVTLVDASKAKMYRRNFGEFFDDQIANADLVVLSRADTASEKQMAAAVEIVHELNSEASIITTPFCKISGAAILEAIESNGIHRDIHELEYESHFHCDCGCEDEHDHTHGHHADEVFGSFGFETARKFDAVEITAILSELGDFETYGTVLRAKGFVDSADGEWIYFDYVPDESNVRGGEPAVTGRVCVIGSNLNETALKGLFKVD